MDTVDPYAPPTSAAPGSSVASGFARATQVMLGLSMALHVYAIVNSWAGWQYYSDPVRSADPDLDPTTTSLALVAGGVHLVVIFATFVVFGRWIVLAKRECQRLGASQLEFSPGWSVGWYFVPIANLWKPYQAMAEAFRASRSWAGPRNGWKRLRVPVIVPLWWAAWITSSIVDQVSTRLTLRASTAEEWARASVSDVVAGLVSLVLGAVAIVLIAQLTDLQARRRAALEDGSIEIEPSTPSGRRRLET